MIEEISRKIVLIIQEITSDIDKYSKTIKLKENILILLITNVKRTHNAERESKKASTKDTSSG